VASGVFGVPAGGLKEIAILTLISLGIFAQTSEACGATVSSPIKENTIESDILQTKEFANLDEKEESKIYCHPYPSNDNDNEHNIHIFDKNICLMNVPNDLESALNCGDDPLRVIVCKHPFLHYEVKALTEVNAISWAKNDFTSRIPEASQLKVTSKANPFSCNESLTNEVIKTHADGRIGYESKLCIFTSPDPIDELRCEDDVYIAMCRDEARIIEKAGKEDGWSKENALVQAEMSGNFISALEHHSTVDEKYKRNLPDDGQKTLETFNELKSNVSPFETMQPFMIIIVVLFVIVASLIFMYPTCNGQVKAPNLQSDGANEAENGMTDSLISSQNQSQSQNTNDIELRILVQS